MKTNKTDFLEMFSRSTAVTKAWKQDEPVDEITLGWWSTDALISFAFDIDGIGALPFDDQYAVTLELARRLEKATNDQEA